MKVWLLVIQGDDVTWIEDAWDDDSTAENPDGWEAAVDKARRLAYDNKYELRVIAVYIPGIYEAFEHPLLQAKITQ